eukprot:m.10869 g.10869  ORF g.10869 m.10869 type:complete len:378 (+) comp5338_c1_seq1:1135-2268(+)
MQLELRTVRPFLQPRGQHVDHLVHGTNVDVVGKLVLLLQHRIAPLEGARAQPGRCHVLVQVDNLVEELQRQCVRRVEVFLGNKAAHGRPVDLVVRLKDQLLAQAADEIVLGCLELVAKEVAHRHVDGAAVGPHAAGVEREPLWQEHHLWEQRMHALPAVDVEYGEPELAPAWDAKTPAPRLEPVAHTHQAWIRRRHAKDAHDAVVERSTENGGLGLDVDTPAAVGVLHVGEVPDDLGLNVVRHRRLGDVSCDGIAWQQKHGAAVVACPVPIARLHRAEERDCLAQGRGDTGDGRLLDKVVNAQAHVVARRHRVGHRSLLRLVHILPNLAAFIDHERPALQISLRGARRCRCVASTAALLHTSPRHRSGSKRRVQERM